MTDFQTALLTEAEKRSIRSLGDGFLEHYITYAGNITDAPREYHLGVGLSMLSATIGSCAWDPLYRARPNLWVLLLGPSSSFRKSTSLNIGTSLLRQMDPSMFVATDFSPQALISDIAGRGPSTSFFLRDEVSGLFRLMKGASYMAGIKEVLIKLFDGDSFERKLRTESISVRDPYFVWLGGGVEDKLKDSIEEDDIFSGFLIRFALIRPASRGPFRPLVYEPATNDERRIELVGELRQMRDRLARPSTLSLGGSTFEVRAPVTFVLEDISLERFNHYLEDLEEHCSPTPLQEKLNSRIGPLAIKLAILLHCSHAHWERHWLNTALIDHRVFLKAVWIAEAFRQHTTRVLMGVGPSGGGERELESIRDFVKKFPGATRGSIMRRFKLRAVVMDDLRRTLVERGWVKVELRKSANHSTEVYYPGGSK